MKKNISLVFIIITFLTVKISSQMIPISDYPFGHIDVLGYNIEIDLTESFEQRNNSLNGIVNIICKVDTTEIDKIYLDAIALIIDSVFVDEKKSDFNLTEDYLIVLLNDHYSFNDTIELKIFYKRTAQNKPGYYFRQSPGITEDVAYTASWQTNTRYWLPCKDWPTDKAFVEMKVKVPEGITVVSNGKLMGRVDENNFSTFVWRDSHPMATYVISFSAARYISVEKNIPRFSNSSDSIQIIYYSFQSSLSQFSELLENAPQIINFYSKQFVEFPFDNLSFVVPGTRFTGMSNQTLIQFSGLPIQINPFYTHFVIPHEIAHQWFGSSVNSADWNLWLTEGLASYAAYLYEDFVLGNNSFENKLKQQAVFALLQDSLSISDGPDTKLFIVLDLLNKIIGDSLYWKSFKNFLETNSYGSATIKEFNEAFNITTGKNYNWFFHNWFYNPGHPKYNISWQTERIFNSYYVFLRIEQTQARQEVFTLPIDITFVTENGDSTVNVLNNERVQIFEFRLNSKPQDVIFDKDTLLLLKEVNYETVNFTPEYSYSLKQNFPNPFNPVTKIEYRVGNLGTSLAVSVQLKVYDVLGKEIVTLVNDEKHPGIYEVEFNATGLSSGVYFYRIQSGSFIETKKMILLR